jgi:hypothetical protein
MLLVTACASRSPLVVNTPVQPACPSPLPRQADGELVVYSATRLSVVEQSEYPVHTDYTITSLDHKLVRQVRNLHGLFASDPQPVALPPGTYRVQALSSAPAYLGSRYASARYVDLPVIIRSGMTTIVHLDDTPALPSAR